MKRSRPIEPAVKDEDFESGERNPSLASRAYRRIKEKILMGEIPPLAAIDDRAYREPVYNVVGNWLKGVYPVSTGLIVSGLARPEMLMEIDVDAVIPDGEAGPRR